MADKVRTAKCRAAVIRHDYFGSFAAIWDVCLSEIPIHDRDLAVRQKERLRTLHTAGGGCDELRRCPRRSPVVAVGCDKWRWTARAGEAREEREGHEHATSRRRSAGERVHGHPVLVGEEILAARGVRDRRRLECRAAIGRTTDNYIPVVERAVGRGIHVDEDVIV